MLGQRKEPQFTFRAEPTPPRVAPAPKAAAEPVQPAPPPEPVPEPVAEPQPETAPRQPAMPSPTPDPWQKPQAAPPKPNPAEQLGKVPKDSPTRSVHWARDPAPAAAAKRPAAPPAEPRDASSIWQNSSLWLLLTGLAIAASALYLVYAAIVAPVPPQNQPLSTPDSTASQPVPAPTRNATPAPQPQPPAPAPIMSPVSRPQPPVQAQQPAVPSDVIPPPMPTTRVAPARPPQSAAPPDASAPPDMPAPRPVAPENRNRPARLHPDETQPPASGDRAPDRHGRHAPDDVVATPPSASGPPLDARDLPPPDSPVVPPHSEDGPPRYVPPSTIPSTAPPSDR